MTRLTPYRGLIANLKGEIPITNRRLYMSREQALEKLREWSGEDFGFDAARWQQWARQSRPQAMRKLNTDYDRLWTVADHARSGKRLKTEDVAFVRDVVPADLKSFPRLSLPKRIRHPAGFSVSGAPVGTFLRSALLLSAQRVLGGRYAGSAFYESVEKDLAFGIMRSHFHHGYPKGTHCCLQCTLAVYPVLDSSGIRYFDCKALAGDVKRLIESGGWRFANPPSESMVRWALLGPPDEVLHGSGAVA